MRALSASERRTIRIAAILLAGYLVLFYGSQGIRTLEARRTAFEARRAEAAGLALEIQTEKTKAARYAKLRERMRIDPGTLRPETVVGEASASIQKAAQVFGIQLGPTKESPAGASSKEIAVIQIEGQGSVASAKGFVQALGTTGQPLVIDSIHVKAIPQSPGQVQMTLGIAVLNFAAWKGPQKGGA